MKTTPTATPTASSPWPGDPRACCRRFFSEVGINRVPNRRIGPSGAVKHLVERAAWRSGRMGVYIPEGLLLDVARELKIPLEPCDHRRRGHWLGIGKQSLRRFQRRYGVQPC